MRETLNVLLIEGDPHDARRIRELLVTAGAGCFRLQTADHLAAGLAHLATGEFDVVLLDLLLLDSQGFATLAKTQTQSPNLPIIVLSDLDDDALAAQALREGAQDYLIKGQVQGDLLTRAIRYAIERKRAEGRLRASEDQFRYVFDYSAVGKSITLPAGEIHVNKALCEMLGYSPEELQSKRWQDLTHPDDIEVTQRAIRDLLSGAEGAARFTKRFLQKNGAVVWVDLSSSLRRDQEGKQLYFVTTLVDITERQRVEAALRESEARYRLLYENSTVGLYRTTPDGRILLANPAMVNIMGFASFDELATRNLEKEGYAPDDDRARFIELIEQAGEVKGLESAWTRQDGTTIFVRESARVTRDEQGQPLYYDGIIEDVTAHKHAEDIRNIAEASYRSIFQNATVGIFQSTPQGHFRQVNPAMARLYGYASPEEMIASIADISHQLYVNPGDRQEFQRVLAEQGEVFEFIGENYRKDQSVIWTQTTARAVKDAQGNVLFYEGFIIDITERKRAEEAQREAEVAIRRMALMLDMAPNSITIFDFDGRYYYANQRTFDLHGFTRDEFMALNLHQLDVPDSKNLIASRMQELLQRGEATFQVAHYRKDGSILPLEVSARVTAWDNQKVILNVATDLTERKQVEHKLWESAERLKEAQRIALIGNWELNLANNTLIWSDEIYRIFEIDPAQFDASYEAFLEAIHPDDRDTVNRAYTASLTTRRPYEIIHRLLVPDGSVKYVHERCETFYDAEGHPIRSVGTVQDITARARAEAQLNAQLEELRRWRQATLGRETRILDLKREVNELLAQIAKPPRYPSAEAEKP